MSCGSGIVGKAEGISEEGIGTIVVVIGIS